MNVLRYVATYRHTEGVGQRRSTLLMGSSSHLTVNSSHVLNSSHHHIMHVSSSLSATLERWKRLNNDHEDHICTNTDPI